VTEPAQITLLTEASCTMCSHAKTVLHRLEQEYPLSIQELDLTSPDGQQLAARAGVMFARRRPVPARLRCLAPTQYPAGQSGPAPRRHRRLQTSS